VGMSKATQCFLVVPYVPPSLVKKTTSMGSPGPARLTAVTFAENGTKAPGRFRNYIQYQE